MNKETTSSITTWVSIIIYWGGEFSLPLLGTFILPLTLKTIGLSDKGLSLHSIRHAFATHLLRSGVDLTVIKELMGHADISSTTIYTHLNHQQLKEAVEKLPINIMEGDNIEPERIPE